MPVADGKPGQRSLEQVTYLEWLNSQYQNEFGTPDPNARTCQQCHMPGNYHSDKKGIQVDRIQTENCDHRRPGLPGRRQPDFV